MTEVRLAEIDARLEYLRAEASRIQAEGEHIRRELRIALQAKIDLMKALHPGRVRRSNGG